MLTVTGDPALHSSDFASLASRPAIKPRWEWRGFAAEPGRWRRALGGAESTGTPALTAEIYLLSRPSASNVKLRNERVEVKELLKTDASGLELWSPVLNEGFPLELPALATLCAHLRQPVPAVVPPLPTAEDLLSFVTRCAPGIRVVALRKWRERYRVRGCQAERTTVVVGGSLLESLALEHADPDALRAALVALDLPVEQNTSYIRALKALTGWEEPATR